MNTNVVFRNYPFSAEVVQHARRCCTKLDTRDARATKCDVMLQSLNSSGDVIACLILHDRNALTVQHVDDDPYRAVEVAVELAVERLGSSDERIAS